MLLLLAAGALIASLTIPLTLKLRRYMASDKATLVVGSLVIPGVLTLGAMAHLFGLGFDVDGPPPGLVIAGLVIIASGTWLAGLLFGYLAMRLLPRRRTGSAHQ